MSTMHPQLSIDAWANLALVEQLANIGSEVIRAISWQEKGNKGYARLAWHRALDLIDMTMTSARSGTELREIARMREALVDYFFGDNTYQSSAHLWQSYFNGFTYAASLTRRSRVLTGQPPATPRGNHA